MLYKNFRSDGSWNFGFNLQAKVQSQQVEVQREAKGISHEVTLIWGNTAHVRINLEQIHSDNLKILVQKNSGHLRFFAPTIRRAISADL